MTLEQKIIQRIEDSIQYEQEQVAKHTAECDQAKKAVDAAREEYRKAPCMDHQALVTLTDKLAAAEAVADVQENLRWYAVGAQTALETLLSFVKMDIDIYGRDAEAKTA